MISSTEEEQEEVRELIPLKEKSKKKRLFFIK